MRFKTRPPLDVVNASRKMMEIQRLNKQLECLLNKGPLKIKFGSSPRSKQMVAMALSSFRTHSKSVSRSPSPMGPDSFERSIPSSPISSYASMELDESTISDQPLISLKNKLSEFLNDSQSDQNLHLVYLIDQLNDSLSPSEIVNCLTLISEFNLSPLLRAEIHHLIRLNGSESSSGTDVESSVRAASSPSISVDAENPDVEFNFIQQLINQQLVPKLFDDVDNHNFKLVLACFLTQLQSDETFDIFSLPYRKSGLNQVDKLTYDRYISLMKDTFSAYVDHLEQEDPAFKQLSMRHKDLNELISFKKDYFNSLYQMMLHASNKEEFNDQFKQWVIEKLTGVTKQLNRDDNERPSSENSDIKSLKAQAYKVLMDPSNSFDFSSSLDKVFEQFSGTDTENMFIKLYKNDCKEFLMAVHQLRHIMVHLGLPFDHELVSFFKAVVEPGSSIDTYEKFNKFVESKLPFDFSKKKEEISRAISSIQSFYKTDSLSREIFKSLFQSSNRYLERLSEERVEFYNKCSLVFGLDRNENSQDETLSPPGSPKSMLDFQKVKESEIIITDLFSTKDVHQLIK